MHSADASRQAGLARVQDELGTASATMHAVERQLQVKGDEALVLQQRIVGLEVSLDEFRVDAEAQRAKLFELTSRVLEKDAALQSLEGEVRQTEEQLMAHNDSSMLLLSDATTMVSAVDSVGVEAKAKTFENILRQKFTNNGQFVILQLASATPLTM